MFFLVLTLFFFTGCGKKEKQLFGGGVGVGSGGQYSNHVSRFGITINANSNLNYREDESSLHLDNSFFAKAEGSLVSHFNVQSVKDSWFDGKVKSLESVSSYLGEKQPEMRFLPKNFTHLSGLCSEVAMMRGTSLTCFIPIEKSNLLIRARLETFESSPEAFLLSQAMNSMKASD